MLLFLNDYKVKQVYPDWFRVGVNTVPKIFLLGVVTVPLYAVEFFYCLSSLSHKTKTNKNNRVFDMCA